MSSIPIPRVVPPENEAQTWELAQSLDEMDDAARRGLLLDLISEGDPSRNRWLRFLASLFVPGGPPGTSAEPLASEAVRAGERLGYSREQAKALVGRFSALKVVQEAWRRWTRVGDRNELRLRLEVLGQCGQLDPALAPFLLFFFRASDHTLYQAAAVTVGRHLLSCPPLWSYLESYAAQRGIRLDEPLALDGPRSRRRLLLVIAAALAAYGHSSQSQARNPLPELPFLPPHGQGAAGLLEVTQTPADLNAWLHALYLLWMSPQTRERIAPFVEQALTYLVELPAQLVDRRVLRQFGTILVAYYAVKSKKGMTAEEAAARWWTVAARELARVQALRPEEFGQRVAALLRLDEVMRTASFLPEAACAATVGKLQHHLTGGDRFFLLLRTLTWVRRSHRLLPSWTLGLIATMEAEASGLFSPWLRTSWEALLLGDKEPEMLLASSEHRGHPELLDKLLAAVGSEGQWLSLDAATRALIMLLLLDETQHVGYPEQQLRAFLLRYDLLPATVADQPTLSRSTGTVAVVLKILAWERDGAEGFLDSQLLHQIEDVRVLLALLPSHHDSPVLNILADAFEHQLRWRLQWDPAFDPFLFFYQTTIRDPHPMFFVHLEQVARDRVYQRLTSEELPVHDWIAMLAQETAQVTCTPLPDNISDEGQPQAAQGQGSLRDSESRFTGRINRVRQRLSILETKTGDLRTRILALTDLLGEFRSGSGQGGSTLMGVLRTLHQANRPVLQSGYPAWASFTLGEMERRLQEIAGPFESHASALMPESWETAETVGEVITYLQTSLQEMMTLLLAALPLTEEARFRNVLVQLGRDLEDWLAAVRRVQRAWSEYATETVTVNPTAWNKVMAVVTEAWESPHRAEVAQRVWVALHHRVESVAGPVDPWQASRQLLDWSLTQPQLTHWNEEERERWNFQCRALFRDLLKQAMDARWEGRVVQLLTEPGYRMLRRHADMVNALEEARPWCLDRYRAATALRVQKDIAATQRLTGPSVFGGMAIFFFHFSPVWIGLLVGGFLMLDFGDAWTAMAEIGDIRGITVTFLLGISGTFLYLLTDLRRKVGAAPDEVAIRRWGLHFVRATGFLAVCLVYTLVATSTLWFLLSGTDEVVHGAGAIGHIAAWSGFTLLVGTFFGLIAKEI